MSRMVGIVLSLLFFGAVFLFFFHPIKIGDFWWHLNTGRWIWENGGLPSEDPFAYTTTAENAERTKLVLKGYWLSQVLYYAIYKFIGPWGLVVFNALLFTLITYLLWRILRGGGIDSYAGFIMLIPCIYLLREYDEIRPQSFSFLWFLLLFMIIEKGLREIRGLRRGPLRWGIFLLLPALVVAWANTHRGFIILYAVLAAYLAGEILTHILRERIAHFKVLLFWFAAAILSSLLNPNFISPVLLGLKEVFGTWREFGNIVELARPWEYPAIAGSRSYIYLLASVTAVTFAIMALSWRRLAYSHIVLYVGLAASGAAAFRMTAFFILISVAVAGRYVRYISWGFLKAMRPVAAVVTAAFSVYVMATSPALAGKYGRPVYEAALPEGAADFIHKNRPPQPIFNPFGWGGYLSWRLYPEYMVSIDSRFIDASVYAKHEAATLEGANAVFHEYGIKTAIIHPLNPLGGQLDGISIDLLRDDEWRLVYFDLLAAIFVREGSSPLPALDKRLLSDYLISVALSKIETNPSSPEGYLDLADVYYAVGDEQSAEKAYAMGSERAGGR